MVPISKTYLLIFLAFIFSCCYCELTRDQKQYLLDQHNSARNEQKAANMRRMEWSKPLAEIAEATARSCSNEPASKDILSAAVSSKFSWVGENRQLLSSAVQVNQSVLNQVLSCWLTGTADCQYKEINRAQILFPDTYLIGCGAAYFSPEQRCHAIGTGVVVICFYAPGAVANIVPVPGESCSQCPSDAPECINGLCASENSDNVIPADPSDNTDSTIPYVWWITPGYGSYAGGTLLTLNGRGFSKDQFNRDDPNLGNRVTLYNDQYSIPCQVVTYYTSTTKIVCRTGSSPEKKNVDYKLQVLVDGKDIVKDLNGRLCNGNCIFRYRDWATPTVTDVWPHAKIPGVDPMNITISGRIFSYLVSDTQEANEDFTITQTVDRLLIGGQQCNPWNNNTDTPYGGVLTTSWGLGYISCQPETTRIDSMNATLVLSLYGNSYISKDTLSVDNKLRQYIFQTHSDITRVEPNVGSPNGGTLITIYGIHFNDPLGDVKAFISGIPCDIVNYTATTIQCITRPAPPTSSVYPGGRGIVREVWTKDYSSNLDRVEERPYGYPNTSFNWTVQERAYRDYNYPTEFGEIYRFQQRYTGFFVPPIDSLYTFNFISDDRLRLYLSPNTSREHKELIAYAGYTRGRWDYFDTQFSRPIPLQGGKAYYIEAVQQQGGGGWSIGIGAKIHSLNWTNDRADVDYEEQQVTIQSVVVHETQEINITAKPKIQVITFDSEDNNFTYYLSYLNNITHKLTDSDNASVIASALNDLPTVQSFGRVVVYINVTDNEQIVIVIIFLSYQKDLADFKVINQSNHTCNVLQDFTKPSHFNLSLSSRHTNSMPIHESANNVTSELLTLFTTNCHITGVGNVYFKDGYDVIVQPYLYGTLDNSHEPYCGRYSLKNPTIMWRYDRTLDERSGERVDPMTVSSIGYKYVCFGIYGTLPNSRLRIYGRINERTTTYVYNIPVTDNSGTNKWRFLCVDVYSYLNERYNQQSNTYQVLRTYFYSSSTDFWVDEVMFTTSIPTITQLEHAVRPNGIFVDTVTVSSTSPTTDLICYDTEDPLSCNLIVSRYVVEFKVHHCDYNMPLLSSSPNNVLISRLYSGTPAVNGTFQLTFENQTIYNIPANALASELKTLLEMYLPNEGGFEVTRSGDCSGYIWSIKWTSRGGDLPLMSANGSGLSGHMVNISVVSIVNGGVWLRPFRGDMLRLPELKPQVEVLVNGIPASCRSRNCSFKFSSEVTPQIISVSPSIGGQDNTPITIYGTGFTNDINNVTVTIGNSPCDVTSVNDTVISCVPIPNVAGPQNVSVHVDGVGYSISSTPNSSIFQYSLVVNSIQPDKGSISGGNLVTITGVGFPTLSNITKPLNMPFYFTRDFYVVFDDFPCVIVSSNLTVLTCTPQPHDSDVVNVTVVVNGVTTIIDSGYEYTANSSATITSISPLAGPVYGGTKLTISGNNFNLTDLSDIVINIGQTSCVIISFTATEINCTTSPHNPGVYDVSVHSTIFGVAFNESQTDIIDQQSISLMEILDYSSIKMFNTTSPFMLPMFTYQLIVTKLTPCSGSLLGGTKVSIKGTGFGSNVTVTTGLGIDCSITTGTYENIECVTSSTRKEHLIDNSGQHAVLGRYFAWNPANIEILPGDTVTWNWTGASFVTPRQFEVHQTASPTTSNYLSGGFQSTSSVEGTYSYTFTQSGVYYFASYVDDVCQSCLMSGSITVKELEDIATAVIVKVDGFEALYNLDYHNDFDLSPGSGQTECLSCQNLTNSLEPKSSPIFVYSNCNTPVVKWINGHISTLYSNISLSGYDFGLNPSKAIIKFGDYSCTPLVYSDSLITCRLNMASQPTPFNILPLSLHICNSGFAFLNSEAVVHRTIIITPVIKSISPLSGSVLGGNIITITGASFIETNLTVYIGTERCTIIQVSYYQIQCIVPRSVNISMPYSTVPVNVSYGPEWEVICDSNDGCDYQYSLNATPMIFAVDPIIVGGVDVQTITINGELLESDSTVMVGPFECVNVTLIDFENITCQLSPIQAGKYLVSVLVPSYGFAQFSEETDNSITSQLRIDGISPLLGSIRGGTKLTISGIGFSDYLNNNSVSIGNSACQIVESKYTSISCFTPDLGQEGNYTVVVTVVPANSSWQMKKRNADGDGGLILEYSKDVTPQIMSIEPVSGQQGDVVTISGHGFTSDISLVSVSFGRSKCNVSFTNDTNIVCTLGPNYIGSYQVEAVIFDKGKADGQLTFMYTLQVDSVSPINGSFAGQNILTILGVGFNPVSTFITVCNQTCLPSFTQPSLTSIQCIIPSFSYLLENTPSLTSQVCNVTVTSLSSTVSLPQAYILLIDLTPNVTSINRTRGGTAGGSIIELIGSGFSNNVTVTIAGVDCSVLDKTQSTIVCQTGASGRTIKAPVMVYVEGKGYAISNDIEFYYVDLWSSEYTWGGLGLPKEGDFVIVPAGQTLVLDIYTPVLKILLIQGGELIFDDEKDGVQLHSEHILITDGGKLQVGTEDQPYQHKAQIVMYGHVLSTELPLFGAKTLAVRNGTLDLHGKPIANTWTWLSTTAYAGNTTLHLKNTVADWEVGGKVVIASTSYSQRENEELTIVSIGADKMSITVDPPLQYTHIAVTQVIHGRVIETRAEVGYLTRNVVVRGNKNSEWNEFFENCPTDFDPGQFAVQTCFNGRFGAETIDDQFGSQIMLHRGPRDKVIGRIEYIEVTHAGQAFRLGRYPIHFHLNGDVSDSYVRGCAIHHTFNRAVTIHGVDYLLVEKNVAYNILGHAYFLEDGIEQGNVIQYNLGIFVRASSSLLNVDITPATFWAVNPNNTLRHNAAAGGTHFGFWYRLPENPTGPSFTTAVEPLHLPLGEFTNNSAHSFGWYGIWIFPSYHPEKASTCDEVTPAVFEKFLAWRNVRGVEFSEVGAVQLKDSVMLDNTVAGVEYTKVTAAWGKNGSLIEDVLIVAHSGLRSIDNVGTDVCTGAGIKTPHSYYLTVSNVTFVNFDESNCYTLQACSHCREKQGGFETKFEKLVFDNSPNIATWKWEHEQVFRDMDGTLTGTIGGALLPTSTILPSPHCSDHSASSFGAVRGSVCNDTVHFARFALTNPTPSSLTTRNLNVTSQHGILQLEYVFKRLLLGPGYMALLPIKEIYQLDWDEGERFNNISYSSLYSGITTSDYLWIKHDFNKSVDYININEQEKNASLIIPPGGSSQLGDWYVNNNETSVTYYVNGSNPTCPSDVPVSFTSYRCFYENCIPPPPLEPPTPLPPGRPNVTYLWSDQSIWPNELLPQNDTDVYINCSLYILVDVPLPRIKTLTVCGGLEFLDERDHILEANLILIDNGRLIAGSEDMPFQHQLTIILNGNLNSPEYRLPNLGPVLGAKGIGVFGQLSLHGKDRSPTWTFLAKTAKEGDTQVVLSQAVDWQIGEEIVIASTFYEAGQTEERTITSISNDGLTLSLNSPLTYNHLGGVHNTNSCSVNISAEVGLLSRNIKILGTHPNATVDVADQQSYGCRVLVGTYFVDISGTTQYTGSAQLEGVEFKGCGQEGFVESFDPRYSLAFLNIGQVKDNSSYVKSCSFHKGYNTGIGIFGTKGMSITNNVVHHTVGPSLYITGSDHQLIQNLAVVALFPGTYNGRNEPWNAEWTANFELVEASNYVLIGNSAAGGAKAGYHTNGENCISSNFSPTWKNNIAHTTLHGIHVGYNDGHFVSDESGCSSFHDFTIYSCYHYGLFSYSKAGVLVTKSTFVNNYAAIFTAVIGPAALSHRVSTKTVIIRDSEIISSINSGVTINCTEYSFKPTIGYHARSHSGIQSPWKGHVGIILSSFTSGPGHFPKFPWTDVPNYPAIKGLTKLNNVSFCNFGTHCSSMKEVALMTHPKSEDCQHPVWTEGISFLSVNKTSKFYNHNPILGSVNPSDCVDMDCDALKKILIRDLDGSFTGSTGLNSLISKSEFEWDGDRRRGLGDYRIPKTMLATPTGSKIDPDVLYPNKGIYRGSAGDCQWEAEWNSYHCTNIDHMMFVLESLDADTEVRRLSPIGVGANGYIDLINGPQDHGWCGGYTCQERISTFYAIVSTGLNYTIGMTSTNPQKTNLYLLNANDSQGLVIAIIYTNPQRLDVYVGTEYIIPTNGYIKDGNLRYKRGDNFIPTLSDSHGTNYYDRNTKRLHIVIKGETPVRIETTQVIQLGIDFPPLTVNEFFEVNLIQNLALLLGITPNRIRIVNVISESAGRKRETGHTRVEFEIGAAPSNETTTPSVNGTDGSYNNQTGSTPHNDTVYKELLNITTRVSEVIQTGELSKETGYDVLDAVVIEPQPVRTDPTQGVRATNVTGGPQPGDNGTANLTTFYDQQVQKEEEERNDTNPVILSIPTRLGIVHLPSEGVEGILLTSPIKVAMYDGAGLVVSTLGVGQPWQLTVSLISKPTGGFLINSTANMGNGIAQFSDLLFSHSGTYRLQFDITYPLTANFSLTNSSNVINIQVRQFYLQVISQPPSVTNTTFPFSSSVTVHILDSNTNTVPTNLGWRGRQWFMTAAIILTSTGQRYEQDITVNIEQGVAQFQDIHVKSAGSYKIQFSVSTNPPSSSNQLPQPIDSNTFVVEEFPFTRFIVTYNNSYNDTVRGFEDEFKAALIARIQENYPNILVYNVSIYEGSIIATFFVTSNSANILSMFANDIQNISNTNIFYFSFRGNNLILSSVQQDPSYPIIVPTEAPTKTNIIKKYFILIIACSAVGGALLLVMCLTITVICCQCIRKRRTRGKYAFNKTGSENLYEAHAMHTMYRNSPIFDEDGDYPVFHLVPDDDNKGYVMTKNEDNYSSFKDPVNVEKNQVEYLVSKEVKVGNPVPAFNQMTQDDVEYNRITNL